MGNFRKRRASATLGAAILMSVALIAVPDMLTNAERDDAALATSGGQIQSSDRSAWLDGSSAANLLNRWFGARKADTRILVPGGKTIGVVAKSRGVLVIGLGDVDDQPSPARLAGLRVGDVIEAVDGVPVNTAQELQARLTSAQDSVLAVKRDQERLELRVSPIADSADGAYRLGAWVRDGAAGVGTLSFYDPETGSFGALGHAICDGDTGTMLALREGQLTPARVTGIQKSAPGRPGELIGTLTEDGAPLGIVQKNTTYGVFGTLLEPFTNPLYPNGVPTLPRNEVRTGPAQLLADIDNGGIRAYDCEIISADPQLKASVRGLVVRVTDEALLSATGGIVQGMSGSPILQNGRLLGAVTHVCLNDPASGYGVYIDWMLEQTKDLSLAA